MTVIRSLETSVAAMWRRELVGDGPVERRHWRTKAAHYRAVAPLLGAQPDRALRWESVVEAVQPRGSRSTFYEVTGANAAHPLMAHYLAARTLDGAQIAFCYRRALAVDQLIDETKVYSYWPFRESWLDHWRRQAVVDEARLEQSLLGVVAEWARQHPALAVAVEHAPPACTVEDLALVRQGKLPPLRAYRSLTEVVAEAIGGPPKAQDRHTPYGAEPVRGQEDGGPGQIPSQRQPEPEELLLSLAQKLTDLGRGLPFLPRQAPLPVARPAICCATRPPCWWPRARMEKGRH
jgi:hypothetical protein